jgi:hypothetical protein
VQEIQPHQIKESGLELKDVIPSAIHALNPNLFAPTSIESIALIPPSSHVLVLLVDGLGEIQLQKFGTDTFLSQSTETVPMRTQFPSTTPVALGSLGTGETPGQHGFVGASFFLPEEDALFAPLKWGRTPHPISMTPSTPLFEWAAENGINVASIAREKYRNSGITRSVLRGGVYFGAADLLETENLARARLNETKGPALTYIYWPDLDRIGHVHGSGSPEWMMELSLVDSFISRLASLIMENKNQDISLIVTSDHGMVTCPIDRRIHIESNADLTLDVSLVAGDPRARHIYMRTGAANDGIARWQATLGDDFTVISREDLTHGALFSDLDPDFYQRLGDFMVIAHGNAMLSSISDSRTSSLLGQHGSVSEEEMLIPLRIFHSALNN